MNIVVSSNTIETRIGEWRKVQLADGSLVSAGPNTLVQVDYSEGVRRIRLAHGEALFEVVEGSRAPVHRRCRRCDRAGASGPASASTASRTAFA